MTRRDLLACGDETNAPAVTNLPQGDTDVWPLLQDERQFFVTAWTVLNEMRMRRELPAWVQERQPHLGSIHHMQERRAAMRRVDLALLDASQPTVRLREVIDVQAVELKQPATRGSSHLRRSLHIQQPN